jgi:hypothetical protein
LCLVAGMPFGSPTENKLDNVTLIRVVAGLLAIVVFVILVFRLKKKTPR